MVQVEEMRLFDIQDFSVGNKKGRNEIETLGIGWSCHF